MGAVSLSGARAISAVLTVPRVGPWVCYVGLAGADGPADGAAAALVVSEISLSGTVRRTAPFAGSRRALVVAGGGGWRSILKARSYSHPAGVKRSDVLADAAREAGERVSVAADAQLGTSWVRQEGPAERVLRLVTGGEWWVDAEGVTQTGPRDHSPIGSPFQVIDRRGDRGRLEIATDRPGDWMPGRTFSSPTTPDVQTISSSTIEVSDDGKLRVFVLAEDSDSERDRLLADVRALVRSELSSLSYAGVWEYEVGASGDRTIDARSLAPGMPDLLGCPVLLPGRVAPPAGARALVAFVNRDPARPVCLHVAGDQIEHHVTVEAMAMFTHNVWALLCLSNGMFIGPATAPTVPAAINGALALGATPAPPTKEAQEAAAVALGPAMAPGAPGPVVTIYRSAIDSALSAKRANLSGDFPGVGQPAPPEVP